MPRLSEEHVAGVESPDFPTVGLLEHCGWNTHVPAKLAEHVEATHQLIVLGNRAFGKQSGIGRVLVTLSEW